MIAQTSRRLQRGFLLDPYRFFSGPADSDFSKVVLLMHGDGANGSTAFLDSSFRHKTMTAHGGAQISTAQSMFGGSSMLFDGSGDGVRSALDAAYDMRADAFAIEAFVRLTSFQSGALQTLLSKCDDTPVNYEWAVLLTETYIEFYFGRRGSNVGEIRFFWPSSMLLNTWHHVVLQRDASADWACYLDGVIGTQYQENPWPGTGFGSVTTGTFNFAGDFGISASTNPLTVGLFGTSGSIANLFPLAGYVDDLRYTVGASRYSGGSFTVPSAAFPDH